MVGRREKFDADQGHDGEAADEGDQGDREHRLATTERPSEHVAVEHMDPVDAVLDAVHEAPKPRNVLEARARRIVPDRRQHRVEREADEQAHQHRDRDRHPELEEKPADDALHEGDRHEHRDDRERRRHHRKADLFGTLARRRHMTLAE